MNRHGKDKRESRPNRNTFKIDGCICFGNCNKSVLKYCAPKELTEENEEKLKISFMDKAIEYIINTKKIDSLALLLNKYLPISDPNENAQIIKGEDGASKNGKPFLTPDKISEEGTKRLFYKSLLKKFKYSSDVINSLKEKRVDAVKSNLAALGYKVIFDNILKTISPLVCGLGALHVLETSITLHHIWGVPYIPGSSLKGVCRHVVFWRLVEKRGMSEGEAQDFQKEFDEKLQKDDKEILKYQLLFGAQDFKGLLLFLDAYPEVLNADIKNLFRLDIMNPHYSSYYKGKNYKGETKELGDWENPNPVFFLTVREGVPFRFVVLFVQYRWERVKKEYKEINLEIGNKEIEDIIKEALNLYGVGSKTRLGYGLFE